MDIHSAQRCHLLRPLPPQDEPAGGQAHGIHRFELREQGSFFRELVNPTGNGIAGAQVQHLKDITRDKKTRKRFFFFFSELVILVDKENGTLSDRSNDIVRMSIIKYCSLHPAACYYAEISSTALPAVPLLYRTIIVMVLP